MGAGMARRTLDVYTEWRGGTCRVKWWTGEYHESGRKRFESKGGFLDDDEAFQYGMDQMSEIRSGTHVSNRDGATLMSDWLDDWVSTLDHAPLTEKQYRSHIKNHIRPYFHSRGVTVGEIDIIAYRTFKKHITSKVAANTSKSIMMILGMVLDDAVPRLIKHSPVERTRRRGKFQKKPRERKRDMSLEAVEQLARNAEVLFGVSGYAFMWTMAMTGMRPGELFGLTREYCYPNWPGSDPRPDENEEERYEEDLLRYGKGKRGLMPAIRVEHQVQYVEGELVTLPPKYGSTRTLVIPPFLAELLEELLASHDSKWVFPAAQGGCLAPANFNYAYWHPMTLGSTAEAVNWASRRLVKAGVPSVPSFVGKRLYLVRHGHKAWLDEDGHSRFAVESRMGHEVPGVEGIYSSVTVPMERAIMKSLQKRRERLPGR